MLVLYSLVIGLIINIIIIIIIDFYYTNHTQWTNIWLQEIGIDTMEVPCGAFTILLYFVNERSQEDADYTFNGTTYKTD